MEKLPKELSDMIDGLCRQGDQFAGMEQYDDAIDKYGRAWDLLPEPRSQWPAATWILMSAGDAHFRMKEFDEAADLLADALEYPDGDSNPFLALRLGQCLLELGQLDGSANALEEALRMGGRGTVRRRRSEVPWLPENSIEDRDAPAPDQATERAIQPSPGMIGNRRVPQDQLLNSRLPRLDLARRGEVRVAVWIRWC